MKLKTTFVSLLIALLASTQVAFALASTTSGSPLTPPITTPIPDKFTNLSAQMPYPGNATFNFTYNGSASYFYVNASTLQDMSWDVYLKFAEGSANPISLTNPTKWDKYSCGRTLYWQVITSSGDKSPIQKTTVNCLTTIPVGTFTNLSANLTGTQAYFNFTYSGPSTPNYHIDMSTYQDMSWDVYMGFASSYGPPISLSNPQAKWDKYSCGRTLYWRAYDANRRSVSSIQTAAINCATPTPTPTLTPTPTPTPVPTPFTRVFLTSTTYSGNLGGLTGADAKCQARANAANLGGTWKAWLSDNAISAASRLNHNSSAYKRVDGATVANNWNDLIDGLLTNPILVTELGATFPTNVVATGTNSYGNINFANRTCSNWTSNTPSSMSGMNWGTTGDSTTRGIAWTDAYNAVDCGTNNFHLYCFEQPASASQSATPKYNPMPTPVAIPIPTKVISGTVNYKINKTLTLTVPASGVTIEATNIATGEKFLAKTNFFGSYSLKVKLGQYKLRAYDTKRTVFSQVGNFTFTGILNTIRFW